MEEIPYRSDAQRRWAHTKTGMEALGGPNKVAEWDKASRGKNLPEKAKQRGGGGLAKAAADAYRQVKGGKRGRKK